MNLMLTSSRCIPIITIDDDSYDGEFDFAAKSKLASNNLYLRQNKNSHRQPHSGIRGVFLYR